MDFSCRLGSALPGAIGANAGDRTKKSGDTVTLIDSLEVP